MPRNRAAPGGDDHEQHSSRAADPGADLRWTSSLPPFISGEHSFTLTEANGGTRLVQAETFSGLLVPLSGKTFARAETSFQGLNEAIKKRAEAR